MQEKLRRALIVGAGRIAGLNEADPMRRKPCTHLGSLRSRPDFDVVGVVDAQHDHARAFADRFRIVHASDNLERSLEELKPEIVTVAVPYQYQPDLVRRIASSRWRPRKLLLEKPLAATLSLAEETIAACDRAGIAVIVNNECAAPVYRQIRDLIAEQFNNEAISVSAWCSSGLLAVGVHVVGVLRYLFGRVAWVRAVAETEHVPSLPFSTNFVSDDPRVHAMMMFENGVSCFLTNSALTCYTYKEFEITCRRGKLRLMDNGGRLQVWHPVQPGASTISYHLSEPETVDIDKRTAFATIADLLAEDDPSTGQSLLGADVSLDVYRILDALIRSAETRREIFLSSV